MLRTALAVVVSVALPVLAAEPKPLTVKAPAAKGGVFMLLYQSPSGALGEVRVNDVPMFQFEGNASGGGGAPVGSWLKAGSNVLTLTLEKPLAKGDRVTLSVHAAPAGSFPDEKTALFEVQADAAGAWSFELPADLAPQGQLWKRAAVVERLTDDDVKALTALARTLLTALQKGDVKALVALRAYQLEELALVNHVDKKRLQASLEDSARELKKDFAKAKLPEKLECRLVAGGRLVRVRAPGGGSPISVKTRDGERAMDVTAAKVDGKWTLVE